MDSGRQLAGLASSLGVLHLLKVSGPPTGAREPPARHAPGRPPTPLERAAIPLFLTHARNFTVQVGLFDDLDEPISHATGTCVSIGPRKFIATAAHCFHNANLRRVGLSTLEGMTDYVVAVTARNYLVCGPGDEADGACISTSD